MSNCELYIELDDSDRTYRPGDTITGRVGVSTDSEIEGAELDLAMEWYTHGRGNVDEQLVARRTLYTGDWQAGADETHAFSLEVPPGPFSFHGHYVNVDWQLRATADIPWAFDPETNLQFTLEPGATGEEAYAEGDPRGHERRVESTGGPASVNLAKLLFGLAFAGVPLFMFANMLGSGGLGESLISLLFLGAFASFGGWMLYGSLRNMIAGARLEKLDVELEPAELGRERSVTGRIAFTPNARLSLNGVTIALKCRERAVSGSGTNETTHTHLAHQSQETIPESVDTAVSAGERARYEAAFEIPGNAPYTFHASDNDVEWQVEFHVDIAKWPDLVHSEPLLVRPSPSSSTGSVEPEAAREGAEEADEEYEVVW